MAGALEVAPGFGLMAEGGEGSGEELLEGGRLFFERVVDPLALAASLHEAGAAEVGEVAGDFGLIGVEGALQKTDADLALPHEMKEAEAVLVRERGEESGV